MSKDNINDLIKENVKALASSLSMPQDQRLAERRIAARRGAEAKIDGVIDASKKSGKLNTTQLRAVLDKYPEFALEQVGKYLMKTACRIKDTEAISYLLTKSAPIPLDEVTPQLCMEAAKQGRRDVLFAIYANMPEAILQKDEKGKTVADYAREGGYPGLADILQDSINVQSVGREAPAKFPASKRQRDPNPVGLIEMAQAPADVAEVRKAVYERVKECATHYPHFLRDRDETTGRSVLSYLLENGHFEAAKVIFREDPGEIRDKDETTGRTILSYLVENGHLEAAKVLIQADPDAIRDKDKSGKYPLQYCANLEIRKELEAFSSNILHARAEAVAMLKTAPKVKAEQSKDDLIIKKPSPLRRMTGMKSSKGSQSL